MQWLALFNTCCSFNSRRNALIPSRSANQKWHLWEFSTRSESMELQDWQTEKSTSRWGSFQERSPVNSCCSTFVFRDVPRTVLENVWICGFMRKSSNLDRAPKMRDSVLRNSWDSFLVTVPSISSETSWYIPQ